MAKDFTTGSFIARWGFAAALVFGTYNPSGYSYIGWLMSEGVTFGPVLAIVGLVLADSLDYLFACDFAIYRLARGLSWRRAVRCHHLVTRGYWLA